MERMPERIDSKFRFVLLAAERAQQLMKGGLPKVDMGHLNPTRTAVEEIVNDMVEWDYGPAPEPVAVDVEADVEGEPVS